MIRGDPNLVYDKIWGYFYIILPLLLDYFKYTHVLHFKLSFGILYHFSILQTSDLFSGFFLGDIWKYLFLISPC